MHFTSLTSRVTHPQGVQGYDHDETTYGGSIAQGRPNDNSQDYSQDNRPHRAFAKKRLLPSEPSPHVIFLGLDSDFTEADVRCIGRIFKHVLKCVAQLQAYLINSGCTIETVTIIRDRSTGTCPFVSASAHALT